MTLPEQSALTPREIVSELDRYIVGQNAAKKAVAIAIRNRWRRRQLDPELREEVTPKNIILIGPTGVGKTEIARRLAALVRAPFVKVEASSYTQVGYVGRDVESMVRDLADKSYNLVKQEKIKEQAVRAQGAAEERLLDLLLPEPSPAEPDSEEDQRRKRTRDKFRKKLRAGELDLREVELTLAPPSRAPAMPFFQLGAPNQAGGGFDLQSIFDKISQGGRAPRTMTIREARPLLIEEEAEKLVDETKLREESLARAQDTGIIFIDEIDKVAAKRTQGGPDVSGEGVQRDLLPILEGSSVQTRYGSVKTDHVLFVAAGAFHVAKPSDLIPELQGRFPIRVELSALERADLLRILTEPKNALTRQYQALLRTEGVQLRYTDDALDEIAATAERVNRSMENIGARRLHTIMETLLDDWLFDAPDRRGGELTLDRDFVQKKLANILQSEDLTRFIL